VHYHFTVYTSKPLTFNTKIGKARSTLVRRRKVFVNKGLVEVMASVVCN